VDNSGIRGRECHFPETQEKNQSRGLLNNTSNTGTGTVLEYMEGSNAVQ